MSSRNSLMTSMIYEADDIAATGELLSRYVQQLIFIGGEIGFYAGRLDAVGGLDWDSLSDIYDELPNKGIDVIVHCDDDKQVWHRLEFARVGIAEGGVERDCKPTPATVPTQVGGVNLAAVLPDADELAGQAEESLFMDLSVGQMHRAELLAVIGYLGKVKDEQPEGGVG